MKGWAWGVLTAVALLLGRLALAGQLDLLPDEAYYWCWSEQPAWGYFDHPPGVAWLIAAGTALFGDTPLGVRAGGVALHSLALGVWVGTTRLKWRAALLVLAPGVLLVPLLATPDAGFLALFLLALIAHQRELPLLAGVLAGAALLFKLPALALIPAMLLVRRSHWRDWAGAGIALAMSLPVLIWNAQSDWPMFGFQAQHGLGGGGSVLDGLGFVFGQLLWLGPITGVAAVFWLVRERERSVWWWAAALPALVFGVASVRSHAELNWGLPIWTAAMAGMVGAKGRLGQAVEVGGVLGAALSLVLVLQLTVGLWQLPSDPAQRFRAGPVLGPAVQAWGVEPVLAPRYQEAALIAFYGDVQVSTVPDKGRRDQFDLWREALDQPLPPRALFVRPARSSERLAIDPYYSVQDSGVVHLYDGERHIQSWQIYALWAR